MFKNRKAFLLLLVLSISCGFSKNSKKEQIVTISTDFGQINLILFDDTPKHKENFLKLAKEGFYDSTTFHRIMSGFMIQGGSPTSKDSDPFNDGMGEVGYLIDAEIKRNHIHVRGALASARQGPGNPEKKSNGSQFYIVDGIKMNQDQLNGLAQQRGWNYSPEEQTLYKTIGGYPP